MLEIPAAIAQLGTSPTGQPLSFRAGLATCLHFQLWVQWTVLEPMLESRVCLRKKDVQKLHFLVLAYQERKICVLRQLAKVIYLLFLWERTLISFPLSLKTQYSHQVLLVAEEIWGLLKGSASFIIIWGPVPSEIQVSVTMSKAS